MRRVISLTLPNWPTDHCRKRMKDLYRPDRPLVIATRDGNRRVVAAPDRLASKAGLRAGQTIGHASALVQELQIAEADEGADRQGLLRLAHWCLKRYGPLVALAPPYGIWIDATGCAHRFGGEAAMVQDIVSQCRAAGLTARAAMADTAAAAYAVAHYGDNDMSVIAVNEQKAALRHLPLRALRLSVGLFESYRQRRREISGQESVATLDHMKDFFGDGQNWAQHVYQGDDGGHCLVAAANHVRVSSIDDAKHWLRAAIEEKTGLTSIEQFNDTRSSFAEIQDILGRARELARAGTAPVPALVGEVLPPVRAALPSPIANTAVAAIRTAPVRVATTPAVIEPSSRLAERQAPTRAQQAAARRSAREFERLQQRAMRRSLLDWGD